MDIEIPPWLQWVSYLAGGEWPQGSENGMFRIQEHFQAAADQLEELIPDLNRVRGETLSVLMGETAQAADEQFAMLFDGDYAVNKLSDAIRALGESSGYTGSEIEYSKLSILVGLALAAAEIIYALSMAGPTWGASTAAIPLIEWATITTIRQLISLLLKRLAAKVREMLARTTVKQLFRTGLKETWTEAGQELAIAATQEGIVYGLQGDRYNVNGERLLLNGIASTVGGGAGGASAVPTAAYLGPAATRRGAAAKGATTFFTAGVVGNLAGTASVGGEFDPFMIIASSTTSSVGGLGGAGVMPANGNTSGGQQPGAPPPDTGSPPDGEAPPPGPEDDGTGTADPDGNDTSSVNGGNNNGQDPNSVNGAGTSEPSSAPSTPDAAADVDGVAAQDDSSAAATTTTADQEAVANDGATQSGPPSTHPGDTGDTPPQTPDGATLTGANIDDTPPGQDATQGLPIADTTPDPSQDAQPVDDSRADAARSTDLDFDPESVVAEPITGPATTSATTSAIADTEAPAGTAPVADQGGETQTSPAPSGVGPAAVSNAQAPASSTPSATSTPTAGASPQSSTASTPGPAATAPKHTGQQNIPESPKASPSKTEATAAPAARLSDTTATSAKPAAQQDSDQPVRPPDRADDGPGRTERTDCLDKLAEKLSAKLGRPIRLAGFPSPRGRSATEIYRALGGGSEFADYRQVRKVLGKMENGSFAILTSAWAGGPNRGGHAYLAIKENGQIRFEDAFTDQPLHWDESAVLRTAVGYFHADGQARQALQDVRQLVPAAAIGEVQGPPLHGDGSPDGDGTRGDQWQGVVPQSMVAESALERRGLTPDRAGELRNPLGLMEAASERARNNATWWDGLTGAEQRALIDTFPQHIGNAEGIPATARHEANTLSLARDRAQLQGWRDRGLRLTSLQRKELARLERIDKALTKAASVAKDADVGGPLLLAFDPMAFGGDGRAVVAFGSDPANPDPYQAESVSWHVPGQGITIDQIGACMGDALNHLQSVRRENSDLNAASIAWIGYDTPSGWQSWRAAGSKFARAGGAILYSDIRAFNTARDTRSDDGSHFSGNHIFAHSYGSTATSYAGRDGRLARDVTTVSLAGSPGAGPLQHAGEFGIGERNVFVASSSRDRFTAFGGRRPGSIGRIFGRGLGIDPAMESFGAQRVTAEFPASMDRRSSRGTHNSYYRFVDRAADVRSESSANFGRIAAGHPDRLHFESHRTLDERPWYRLGARTVEPAMGRPLHLDGDTGAHHSRDRLRRRFWNPRWEFSFGPAPAELASVQDVEAMRELLAQRGVDAAEALMNPMVGRSTSMPAEQVNDNAKWWAGLTSEQRQELIETDPRRVAGAVGITPADLADARARANAAWWAGLTPDQRQLLIELCPYQIGNAEGIFAQDRDAANHRMLQRYLARAGELQAVLGRGERLTGDERKFLERVNRIDKGLRDAREAAEQAGVGGPLLLAFDPLEFGGDGRAVVSFASDPTNPDPYRVESVSWHMPGVNTTIDDVGNYHDPVFFYMRGALAQLQSTMREGPNLTAASMLWIGYDAPLDSRRTQPISSKMARAGGEILYSDIRAFNAARNTWAGDGSKFTGNHLFGHSYGSTTTSHAGRDKRLAGHISSVTLLGSPGAGPQRHASDFGIGSRVFVAASSWDPITGLGARRYPWTGRILGKGLGIDPAMASFGAKRITSEFPAAMNTKGTVGTHRSYYEYVDAEAAIRSESLANFGRIAAGRPTHEIQYEAHRTVVKRPWYRPGLRTAEPAVGRPLRLDSGIGAQHWDGRHLRQLWTNPLWLPGHACGPDVVEFLSGWHDRDFELVVAATREGVPARAVFEAVGSRAEFATYADVEQRLRGMEPGSSAVLTSSWSSDGGRRGGHAYVAIYDGTDVFLWDPFTRTMSGWPPYWSGDAVSQTAVGYLHRNGDAANPLGDTAAELAAADEIGHVTGRPDGELPARAVADAALDRRVPRVWARQLVHPLGDADRAAVRARENAAWWDGLSPGDSEQLRVISDALIDAYPHQIGNAEGVPADVRDIANRAVLERAQAIAERLQSERQDGKRLNAGERKFLRQVQQFSQSLHDADVAAEQAGLDPPLLLAFDPRAFGGDGRALISFGADPYQAENVAWHIDRRAIHQPGVPVGPVLDRLRAQQESGSAAAVVWIGNNTNPLSATRNAFYSDLAAFHAARDARAETGEGRPLSSSVHALRHPSLTVAEGARGVNPLAVSSDAGPLVIAHRGASYDFPEQTLAAYKEALRQGANGLECDVHLTKDGHLVCIHDRKVNRTSDGTGRVDSMTLAELRALDFGAGQHGSENRSDTGILTLDELVALVREQDRPVTLFVEIKHSEKYSWKVEREVVALLERHGLTNPNPADQARAAVISFFPDGLKLIRSLAPNLPTVFLAPRLDTAPLATALASHRIARAIGANGISHYVQTLRAYPELADLAAAHGLIVYPGVVNEQLDAQYSSDLGVPWVGTDHPARTHTWLGHQSESATPTETPVPTTESASAVETGDTKVEPAPAEEPPRGPTDDRTRADEALAKRVPPVRPDELRNPMGRLETNQQGLADEASARARHNATWWHGLDDAEKAALIKTYPEHIGNAEGIPPTDRDAANRVVLEQFQRQADAVRAKLSRFELPSLRELRLLRRFNRIDLALQQASREAAAAGESTPLLLAFDPAEFGGDGRAVLSFGDDPYHASSVSWHAPGINTSVHSRFFFGFYLNSALNHLQSVRAHDPNLTAASIAWIGYDAPSGVKKLFRAAGHKFARAGGDILYSDIRAFNAGRDTWAPAADGTPFTGNHVFGHSYGSTVTSYAGQGKRLADHVTTISLVGSPGAGPQQHARDFGLEPGKVFVASSARDLVTALGGRKPGSSGRILGIGLGIDPAMDSFGAVRVTAEVPTAMNRPQVVGTHDTYWLYTDAAATVSSEGLHNLGGIAAGRRADELNLEKHRTAEGWRSVEPAAERSARRPWNPPWRRPNCALSVVEQLSERYTRPFRLAITPTARGVPARALFEAANVDAEFATYDEVEARLRAIGPGSSAILASRWSGWRGGGHAYLAVYDGGAIQLRDIHSGQRSGWPPHWGEGAVARTAVGYLNAVGEPDGRADVDVPLRLGAAEEVGHVKGLRDDSDFRRRQEDYRADTSPTRRVDSRYAHELGAVVDNAADTSRLNQFADDLSGRYGPYRVEFTASQLGKGIFLEGDIFNGSDKIGRVQLEFERDKAGKLVAYETGTGIDKPLMRGKGFYKALHTQLEGYYVRSGVDRIESGTHFQGSAAAAHRGFMWDPTGERLGESLERVRDSAVRLQDSGVSDEARILLAQVIAHAHPQHPRLPELIDLASLNTPDEPDLGRRLLEGVRFQLSVVKYFPTQSPSRRFQAWLQNMFGLEQQPRSPSRHDCAHRVLDLLSAMYGRDFRLAVESSRRGVPARALFDAVGTDAHFASYDDVADRLRQLGDRSSAVLASRWADTGRRQPGHAYLARNIGGEIFLIDPFTGARSGWPPHWGPEAVARTAVGYLDRNGDPADGRDVDAPRRRDAASAIGRVKGHPDDAGFVRRQEAYRALDPFDRDVASQYAEAIPAVLASKSSAGIGRLAQDLSGRYGDYVIEFDGVRRGRLGVLEGVILRGNRDIGDIALSFDYDDAGMLFAHHELHIGDDQLGARDLPIAVISELLPLYERSGVDRIVTTTLGKSAYAAADLGDTWDPARLPESLDHIKTSAARLSSSLVGEAKTVLDQMVRRLDPGLARLPEPVDLANLGTVEQPDLGRRLLEGTRSARDGSGVHYVKYLWNTRSDADQNCGRWAVERLGERFGRRFRVEGETSPTGVAARALFDAIGSRADFHSYAEVEEILMQMDPGPPGGPGPAALVVSSWAGGRSQGGHAYLAVYDGGRIYLEDLFTGERSPWPPYWGEGAVSRTAVGFLNADGSAAQPLGARSDDLVAADEVGHVQGMDPANGQGDPLRVLGLPNHPPGSLSEAAARDVYAEGERRMRALNERLARDGVSVEERARLLSELRDSLRARTRDLMSNRVVADFLAVYEGNPSFAELTAHNEAKGLVGDAVYEAIIETATNSHHAPGTLSDIETTALYTEFELRMRDYDERLIGEGVGVEQRARILSELRTSLRTWSRDLMSNWVVAEFLSAYEGSPTFADLVARNEAKGLTGDAVYEAIVHSATHSHYAQGTLSDDETRVVYTTFELRMRQVHEQLVRDGVGVQDRARTMHGMRAALRSWTRALMANRELAEWLNANERNPTFDALVERQRSKGRTGDAIYEAIIESSTRSRASVNAEFEIDPENPPPLPPMRGPTDND